MGIGLDNNKVDTNITLLDSEVWLLAADVISACIRTLLVREVQCARHHPALRLILVTRGSKGSPHVNQTLTKSMIIYTYFRRKMLKT